MSSRQSGIDVKPSQYEPVSRSQRICHSKSAWFTPVSLAFSGSCERTSEYARSDASYSALFPSLRRARRCSALAVPPERGAAERSHRPTTLAKGTSSSGDGSEDAGAGAIGGAAAARGYDRSRARRGTSRVAAPDARPCRSASIASCGYRART